MSLKNILNTFLLFVFLFPLHEQAQKNYKQKRNFSNKKQVLRIAVLDTGILEAVRLKYFKNVKYCDDGKLNYNAIKDQRGNINSLSDFLGHGSAVTYLINKYTEYKNWCLIVVKIYEKSPNTTDFSIYLNGLKYLAYLKSMNLVDFINISISGKRITMQEYYLYNLILKDNKVRVFVAAGNEGVTLNNYFNPKKPKNKQDLEQMYMAQIHPKFNVVGALNLFGTIAYYSNRGKIVDIWEYGSYKIPFLKNYFKNVYSNNIFTGTSAATPVALAKYINKHYLNN